MLKGVSTCNVIDEESASRAAVVRSCDGAEGFLARRVPDLEFDLFVVDGDHAGAELDADGEVVYRLESFVCELEEEARLSNSRVTDDNVFE